MAASLRKKARRNGLRIYLKEVIGEINEVLMDESVLEAKIRGFKSSLRNVVDQLLAVDDEVLNILEPDEVENDVIESMKILEPSNEVMAKLDLKLEGMRISDVNKSSSSEGASSTMNTTKCKLPKFDLPTFNGDSLSWQGFYDQFNVSVHLNESLSNIDKFNYLKRYLRGEALTAVSGLSLCSENYKEAMDILIERYGNKQVLISAYMSSLLKIGKIKRNDDLKGLRKLHDDVENCMRNLKVLNHDSVGYGSLLIPILKERLPDEMTMIISRRFGSEMWTLEKLMQYFNDELRALENCTSSSQQRRVDEHGLKRNEFTASSLFAKSKYNDVKCIYCQRSHPSSKCRTVTNTDARKDILKRYNRCFVCLEKGHTASLCTSEYRCRMCDGGKHHISICRGKHDVDRKVVGDSVATATNHAIYEAPEKNVLLQTALADVSDVDGRKALMSRLLFDSGSQRTYITDDVRRRLQLRTIRREKVIVNTFGQTRSVMKALDIVQFRVRHKSREGYTFVEALCTPTICSPICGQDINFAVSNYTHLQGLELADDNKNNVELNVEILIGLDYYHQFIYDKVVKGEFGPVALESVLGWIISGPIDRHQSQQVHCYNTHAMRCSTEENDTSLRDSLSRFWTVEEVNSKQDVMTRFQNDIVHDGTRYVTTLPLRPDHDPLPDNFDVCKGRLKSLKKRLDNLHIGKEYGNIFVEYEDEGIIERVPKEEVAKEMGTVHYLPHRPVVREDKDTTKIRVVFDASCDTNGPALNDCLYSGPNLLAKIFDVLIRFRLNKIAILADIKQAFLNVGIARKHQDFLRFLWEDDNGLIIFRFLRVVFGLTSSPFLLSGTIKNHFENFTEFDREFVARFLEDLYVDDVTSGCASVEEGMAFYDQARQAMSRAGFWLRKWTSNDQNLQSYFDKKELVLEKDGKDDQTYVESQFGCSEISECSKRVLGIEWDVVRDEFVCRLDEFSGKCRSITPTKRNVLSVAASIYDPLGFLAPITARIKTIFQMICKDGQSWDDEIPKDIMRVWNEFINVVDKLRVLRIPRFCFVQPEENVTRIELHGFCDSSNSVYCCNVYLRVVTSVSIKVSLLAAKSRVAPIKAVTIPRLELLGCVLLTKLVKEIKVALKERLIVDDVFCWTDSEVVLCWINGNDKKWKPWVENRVVTIREIVPREKWHHVSGKINPADIPTRMVHDFNDCFGTLWFNGPEFLNTLSYNYTEFCVKDNTCEIEATLEAKKSCANNLSLNTSFTEILTDISLVEHADHDKQIDRTDTDKNLTNAIDPEKFGNLQKLINVTGYVLRFISNLKKRLNNDDTLVIDKTLSLDEYNTALNIWIKHEQSYIRSQATFSKLQSSLNLFFDAEGFLRLRGRFKNSELTYEEKYPILLRNSNSAITKLIIWDEHKKVLHHGVETTLASIRSKFWIAKGRKIVKDVIRKCVICIRFQGATLKPPPATDLPDFRVSNGRAFHATGLDFAGPLYVRGEQNASPAYILLFTCASSRAIHLELVFDLSASSFLRAFRRFTSRRGIPDIIIHDNAKTFKAKQVKQFMVQSGITQRYILPASPWWGGFYERLVRSVKLSLKKVLGRALLSFEELQTVLCDVEIVINNRPLVYQSEDDINEVLTPWHLIFGCRSRKHINAADVPVELQTVGDITKRVQYIRKLLQDHWKRFTSIYLNELRQANIYRKSRSQDSRKLIVNDVVLIRDDNPLPRHHWRLGRVTELIIGKDKNIRGAKLQMVSKKGHRTTAYRPVQKLIPLEISNQESIVEDLPNEESGKKREFTKDSRKAKQLGEYTRRLRQKYC